MPSKAHLTRSHSNSKSRAKNDWRRREEISLLSSRALLRFDAYICVGFSTALRGFSIALFSYPSFSFISQLYSSFFSRRARRRRPNPSLFDFLSFRYNTKKRVLLLLILLSRSSSRRSLCLLLLLFLFCLFVLPSSFHSFRPFHRRHDPFSNDPLEPRTFVPRPVNNSFPPLARGEEEERHQTLHRNAASPEAHDRHDDCCTRVSSRPTISVVVLDVKVAQQKSLLFKARGYGREAFS